MQKEIALALKLRKKQEGKKMGHGRDGDREEKQLTGGNKNYLWEMNCILLDKNLTRLWAWVEEEETVTNLCTSHTTNSNNKYF